LLGQKRKVFVEPVALKGVQLFLRYAFPCAGSRLAAGKIELNHYVELQRCVQDNLIPRRRLLKFCFPNAFQALRAYAKGNKIPCWELDTVRTFWRQHHGHEGDCRVQQGVAHSVLSGGRVAKVIIGGQEYVMSNLYNFTLLTGQKVFTHRRVVVEEVI
jgi:hypothetical protein